MDPINISDANALTLDDLKNEYRNLFLIYQTLTKQHEDSLQQIYELQRNIKISKAAEEYLAQELDTISTSQDANLEKLNRKLNQELEELRRKVADLEDYNEILEKKLNSSNLENNKLQEQLCEISASLGNDSFLKTNQVYLELQEKSEIENLKLLAKLNESQDQIQKSLMTIAEKERFIEVLKEEIQCYEENLGAKRTELDEKTTLVESLQEGINELNSELASLKLQHGNENAKGNSLFAEVDDQRQQMKNKLLSQRRCYLEMKKNYNESQFEIRRLKHANSAMQDEIQACISIFVNSKKFYEDKLVERISFLTKQNDVLEKKLAISQDGLLSLAERNEITWLDSMMTSFKNETKELKAQLQNIRLQKGIIEKNYRDSQVELAKWRFEALKLRCALADREYLLEQNLIKFKDFHQMNIGLNEDVVYKSTPQIFYNAKDALDIVKEIITEPETASNTICVNSNSNIVNRNTESPQNELKPTFDNNCITLCDSQKSDKNEFSVAQDVLKKNLKLELRNSQVVFETNDSFTTERNSFENGTNEMPVKVVEYIQNKYNDGEKNKKIDAKNKVKTLFPTNKYGTEIITSNNERTFDRKLVKFASNIKNKEDQENSESVKVITKRTKSNITIKKIIVKSKDDKS